MSAISSQTTTAEAWDAALKSNGGHLLQSWKWGDFKALYGWEPERVHVSTPDGEAWAQVLFRSRGPISIGYIPRGPLVTGDQKRVWPHLQKQLNALARRRRAMSIILEPDQPLKIDPKLFRLKPGPEHNQPGRTVMLPLGPDDVMLAHMHQKTRYSVRLAMRRNVELEWVSGADQAAVDAFYELLEDTANRNEFEVHSKSYYEDFLRIFGDDACFIFARYQGNLCAVVIAAAFGEVGTYMYGASSTQHRGHGAAFLLQFEAMKWARDRGCDHYDLWGIPKIDPDSVTSDDKTAIAGTKGDDWRGIYRFKTGFGGTIINLPDTFEREYIPGLPWLARKLGVIQG